MKEEDFIPFQKSLNFNTFKTTWQAPSNIALIKYWGKKQNQIPANPSISFTLNNCHTTTTVEFVQRKNKTENFEFNFFFEGNKKESFKPKILQFLNRIETFCPYLKSYSLHINSENSFPHSSGIASSASGMSALALCIMDLEKSLYPENSEDYFLKKASFLARLGSGSACRSIEGSLVVWGNHKEIEGSSDLFGIHFPYETHQVFKSYRDAILLVDKGEKQVSSTVGHGLMHANPYAEARFEQANNNLSRLIPVLKSGDLQAFIEIVESEALSLHAVMLSSLPYFILMKPNTLEIINRIWAFRKSTGIPVCFTLDAGANVHMLYPEKEELKILDFIKNQLVVYCEKGQYICDKIGGGAKKL